MQRAIVVLCLVAALVAAQVPASAITNGRPDAGEHPWVGLVVFDVATSDGARPSHRCSGALLSPRVFLTAGHCTQGTVAARVWFQEIVEGNPQYPLSGSSSHDGIPHTHPAFCLGCGEMTAGTALRDVGVVVLTEPAPMAAYGRLPRRGLVDGLANKTSVEVVGYGVQTRSIGDGGPVWDGFRRRLKATTRILSVSSADGVVKLSQRTSGDAGGTCFGDSGGPELLRDSRMVIAVNSRVTNRNCTGVSYGARVDVARVLRWVRSFLG